MNQTLLHLLRLHSLSWRKIKISHTRLRAFSKLTKDLDRIFGEQSFRDHHDSQINSQRMYFSKEKTDRSQELIKSEEPLINSRTSQQKRKKKVSAVAQLET